MEDALNNPPFLASLPALLTVGSGVFVALFAGKLVRYARLPSIIGFMLVGLALGPSFLGMISTGLQENLSFVTDIALSFVAISIGLELRLDSVRKQGKGLAAIILTESFAAFVVVTGVIYLLTGNLPLALIFGALAPASAPAGTVAVIQEYKARGPLTRTLYAVVGFDDGLAIIIFGFASAVAASILSAQLGAEAAGAWHLIGEPLLEILLSFGVGAAVAIVYCLITRHLENPRDVMILTFATVLTTAGLGQLTGSSIILTNMVVGAVAVNTQPAPVIRKIRDRTAEMLPLLFVLFFVLAGANLHIAALPTLGVIGLVYMLGRSVGLVSGSWLGATIGRADANIRKYLGLGILSQAGVAIGLALSVKQEFTALGPAGAEIGNIVITTVTATSIVFEVIGPILAKVGLKRSGEISAEK